MKFTNFIYFINLLLFLSCYVEQDIDDELKLPLATVKNIHAQVIDGGIYITWDPVDAEIYMIFRKNPDLKEDYIGYVFKSWTFYNDFAGIPGESYSYSVQAANNIGSSEILNWTPFVEFPGTIYPLPPIDLKTFAAGYDFISLSWKQAGKADGFKILRCVAGGDFDFDFKFLNEGHLIKALAFTDTGLTPDTEYTYCLITVLGEYESQRSLELIVRTKAGGWNYDL
ncbi:MAG: fibronectin type III domain-containing protein [Treponema sp.]|nr:fibronectin type III domain-containing protein [Treponema sp.]